MTQIEAGSTQPFEALFNPTQETSLIEGIDRKPLVGKIREEYVRLLNQYGKSDGQGYTVVKTPIGRSIGFGTITVISSRKCPDITVDSSSGQLQIGLNSFDHEDHPDRPYDSKTLEEIFPEDTVVLSIRSLQSVYPPLILTFYIKLDEVDYTDHRMLSQSIDEPLDLSKIGLQTPLPHLQNLLGLASLLEEEYRKIPTGIISAETPSVRPALPGPIGRFLGMFRRGNS